MTVQDKLKTDPGYFLSESFLENFGDLPFEESTTKLVSKKLGRPMSSSEIFAAFGKKLVTVGDMVHFLAGAEKHWWYVFFLTGTSNEVWSVRAHWRGSCWRISADSIRARDVWSPDGCLVRRPLFSRLSVSASRS